ncbi:TauD/TfdA family dioxygenase [Streptomyces sp. NBC_00237]|uniref:TauD/TfdA family dioxygenase n=1 Tax=Streptomyces sp. NBC_00237 TaxID=2975687 RepID=UPI002257748A|nr:TauD/TfdA family dioxygenase [Streptomyces sp. NBC_00237]MCX5206729.1 TauD/TfdA family dioxygenase [Streptomyces sp. NBC_00237]
MRRLPPQQTQAALAHHCVNASLPGATDRITAGLRDSGLVVLTGVASRTDVLALAARIMTVAAHRDSDSDGLTTLRDTRRHAGRAGFAGLGNGGLEPHTERSGIPVPPRLMLLVCGQAAESGGDSILVDGRAVHADLLTRSPTSVRVLSQRCTAYFGGGDGHPSQVFTVYDDHRVAVRLRLDGLARFSPIVQPHLPVLRTALQRQQVRLPLLPGQGYVLDNSRWLHARTAFTGDRVCWRALGQPRFVLPEGFVPDAAARRAVPVGGSGQW